MMSNVLRQHLPLVLICLPVWHLRPNSLNYTWESLQSIRQDFELCTGLHHKSCHDIIVGQTYRGAC